LYSLSHAYFFRTYRIVRHTYYCTRPADIIYYAYDIICVNVTCYNYSRYEYYKRYALQFIIVFFIYGRNRIISQTLEHCALYADQLQVYYTAYAEIRIPVTPFSFFRLYNNIIYNITYITTRDPGIAYTQRRPFITLTQIR